MVEGISSQPPRRRVSASSYRPSRHPLPILALVLLSCCLFSLTLGRYPLTLSELLQGLLAPGQAEQTVLHTLLWQIRLPRILAAVMIGGALALSGTAYQGLFRNPMVSPDILGAAAGAALGAALGILLSWDFLGIQLLAFACGILAVMASWLLSLYIGRGKDPMLLLVLTGMVISAVFVAGISLVKYVADPYSKLPAITFWLMGGLASVSRADIGHLCWPLACGILPILLLRWRLNVLSFGEQEARALGLNTRQLRLVIIISATLLTSASVALCGMVGWVGLIIPHLSRLLVGPDHQRLLPASLLIGATFLLLVDDLARNLFPAEIPLGILTALVGAPCFLGLLVRGRHTWQ